MRSFLLTLSASLAVIIDAHPTAPHSQTLHRRAVDLNAFRMVLKTEYANSTDVEINPSINKLLKRADPRDTATNLVKTAVPGATFRLAEDHYSGDNGVTHFYFKQTANELDIDNADFNVNIGRNGEVFSYGNSFYKGRVSSLTKRATVDPAAALKSAVTVLQLPVQADQATAEPKEEYKTFVIKQTTGTVKEPMARLVYVQTSERNLALAWRVETDISSNWLVTYVDAQVEEQIHGVVDYAADVTYKVYPWGVNDPTEGSRIVVTNPSDPVASEFGWHDQRNGTTSGNNAVAHNNHDGTDDYIHKPRPVSPDWKFEYPYSLDETDQSKYAAASTTQLFYTVNKYHDLLHKLGFNERAGNFELNNNGDGGKGGDFVILNSQDGSGMNNAGFISSPDGTPGRMKMFMFDNTTPHRDSCFDSGVVIHEYTHGLSSRLTGGPTNPNCLNTAEAGGMGEGWSDFYANAIRIRPQHTRNTPYAIAAWVTGRPEGLRKYFYTTDTKVNPHVYADVDAIVKAVPLSTHSIGTVWASMLHEVLWNLIDKHGKNNAEFPVFDKNGVPTDGKYLAMKLVLDGLALQPCNPNFLTARDAILDADVALTKGTNRCAIWKGFAKRGLGLSARYDAGKKARTNDFQIPMGVC
ncbi:extracellular metallo proteinase MEP [Massariosphaeria phaeospora]|uniref:Extracellular metalloproteinase n=1 Tax=Massariosphaeria phaeospora TaxID=100035 RepID=A0A7C8MSD2_9PLEO|nr:extracellular metallo proteinase MEP [Massariosphaeria phaeospora]